MAPIKIVVDGIVGAGKTRLLVDIASEEGLIIEQEPVRDYEPWLSRFYGNPAKFAYPLQRSIIDTLGEPRRTSGGGVVVAERCVHSTMIFTDTLRDCGYLTWAQYTDLRGMFDATPHPLPDAFVFLDVPLDVAMDRILKERRRACEMVAGEAFWEHYLPKLERRYRLYMDSFPVPVYKVSYPVDVPKVVDFIRKVVNQ